MPWTKQILSSNSKEWIQLFCQWMSKTLNSKHVPNVVSLRTLNVCSRLAIHIEMQCQVLRISLAGRRQNQINDAAVTLEWSKMFTGWWKIYSCRDDLELLLKGQKIWRSYGYCLEWKMLIKPFKFSVIIEVFNAISSWENKHQTAKSNC